MSVVQSDDVLSRTMYASASSCTWPNISELVNKNSSWAGYDLLIGQHVCAQGPHLSASAMPQPFEPVQPWMASASGGRHTPLLPACISHMLAARRRSEPCDPDTASHTLEESCLDKRQRHTLHAMRRERHPFVIAISGVAIVQFPWILCERGRGSPGGFDGNDERGEMR